MPNSIDERTVQMQFDNDDFQRGIQTSLKSLDTLDQGLQLKNTDKAVAGLSDISNKLAGLNGDFGAFGGVANIIDNVTGTFSNLKRVIETTVISRFTNELITAGTQLTKSLSIDQVNAGWTKYADKTSAVQTIMAATAKDFSDTGEQMEFVNEQLDKLMWFTDETSYNFVDMVGNIGKFTSQGVKLDKSVTSMQGIATWAAISGGNAQTASRAMYNLAQAIGLGQVKLMDWRSIEQANMATVEFKETVLETAVAMGTLKKDAKGVYKTIGKKSVEVNATNFAETLQKGWFTADVLVSTLEKYGSFTDLLAQATEETKLSATELLKQIDDYIDGTLTISEIVEETGLSAERAKELYDELSSETYDLGRRSLKAAQEAKTFAEALDSVKDAVSTQWLKTFEIIFGDYEQAKELWTGLANTLWDVFASGGEARNDLLKEWRDEYHGRDAAIEAVTNAYEALSSIAGVARQAMALVFPPTTAESLYNMTVGLRDFTASLKETFSFTDEVETRLEDSQKGTREITEETFKMSDALWVFKRILQGSLSVVAIGINFFKALGGGALYVAKALGQKSGGLIDYIANFALSINDLRKYIEENDIFGKFVDKLKPSVDSFITIFSLVLQNAKGLGDDLKKYFNPGGIISSAFDNFNKFFNSFLAELPLHIWKFGGYINRFVRWIRETKVIQSGIDTLANVFKYFQSRTKAAFTSLTGFETLEDFLTSLKTNVSETAKTIKDSDVFEKFVSKFKRPISTFITAVSSIIRSIVGLGSDLIAYFKPNGVIGGAFSSAGEIFDRFMARLPDYIWEFAGFINGFIERLRSGKVIQTGFENLVSFFTAFRDNVRAIFTSLTGFETFGDFLTSIKTKATEAASGIKKYIDEHDLFNKALEGIKKFGKGFAGNFIFLFGSIKDFAKNIKTSLGEGGSINKAFTNFKNIFKDFTDKIAPYVDSFKNFIKGFISADEDATILEKIFSVIGGVFSTIRQKISNFIADFKGFGSIGEAFKAAFNKIKETTNCFFKSKFGDDFSLIDKIKEKLSFFQPLVDWFSGVAVNIKANWDKNGGLIRSAFSALGNVFTFAFTIISSVFKWAQNLIAGKDIDIFKVILGYFSLKSAGAALKGFISFKDIMGGISGALETFQKEGLAGILGFGKKSGGLSSAILKIAVAIGLIVGSIFLISTIDPDKLPVAIAVVAGIAAVLTGMAKLVDSMVKDTKAAKKIDQVSTSFLKISASVLVLALALKQATSIDEADLKKGLVGVGALLLELLVFARLIGKDASVQLKGMMGLGVAIWLMVQSMKSLADMDIGSIVKGLVGVGVLLIELGAFMRLAQGQSNGLFKGGKGFGLGQGTAVIAVAAGIMIMIEALRQIADIDTKDIIKGLVGIGVLLIELSAFMALAGATNFKMGSGFGAAAAVAGILLMIESMRQIAEIPAEGIIKGLVGLGLMMVELAAFMGALGAIKGIKITTILGVLTISASLILVAIAMQQLSTVPFGGIVKSLLAFGAVFAGIAVLSKFIGGFNALGTILAVGSIAAAMLVMVLAIQALALVGVDEVAGIAGSLSVMLIAIGGAFALLSVIGIGGSLSAIAALAVAIGGIGLIVAAAGAIAQIPGFDWLMDEGAKALSKIGSAIGGFFGSIIGGVGAGISSGFPIIGQNLSDFMINATPFLDGIKAVDEGTLSAVGNLVDLILKLTAAELLSGITSFITGGNGVQEFANQLPILGSGVSAFALSVAGLDASAVEAGTNAGLLIAGLVDAIPPTGGWVQKITGEADIAGFAEKLPILGAGIKNFAASVSGMDSSAAMDGANAGNALAGLIDAIPPTGGWVQKITGESNIDKFAKDLPVLGAGIKSFADSVTGMDGDAATNGANAGLAIAGLVDHLPESDGWAQKITGEANIKKFAEDIPVLGAGIKGFADAVSGLDADVVTNATSAGEALAELATKLPKEGGLAQAIFGEQSLGTFAEDILAFGTAMSSYRESIAGFTEEDVTTSGRVVDAIVDLSSRIPKTGGISAAIFGSNDLGGFSENISTFASSISDYSTTVSSVNTDKMDAVSTQVQKIIDLSNAISSGNINKMKNNLGKLVDTFTTSGVNDLMNAYDYSGQFSSVGNSFIGAMIDSMEANNESLSTAGANVASYFLSAISPGSDSDASSTGLSLALSVIDGFSSADSYGSGVNFAAGYVDGILSMASEAAAAAASLGSASLGGLNGEIEVNSPSKATQRSAMWFGEGYIRMLKTYQSKVFSASEELGRESVLGIDSGIDDVSSLYGVLNIRPTITPVLDLSEIESGNSIISSMLNPGGLGVTGAPIPILRNLAGLGNLGYLGTADLDNRDVVEAVNSLGDKIDDLNTNIANLKLVLDTDVIAGRMATSIDRELGRKAIYKGRGN